MAQVALLAAALALARTRPAFVDRVEGDRVVLLERGRTRAVPRGLAPGAVEGGCLSEGRTDRACAERARARLRRRAREIPWTAE